MTSNSTDHGRRRFLMGAAGLATVPLVAGITAGCTPDERIPDSPGTGASTAGNGANPVTAATTVTSGCTMGRWKSPASGWDAKP